MLQMMDLHRHNITLAIAMNMVMALKKTMNWRLSIIFYPQIKDLLQHKAILGIVMLMDLE